MEQILLTCSLFEEIVTAIMILHKNTKARARSPGGDTDVFNIIAGVLQWDTLVTYLLILYMDYILRKSIDLRKENKFTYKKATSKKYNAKYIVRYVDILAFFANTPTHQIFNGRAKSKQQ